MFQGWEPFIWLVCKLLTVCHRLWDPGTRSQWALSWNGASVNVALLQCLKPLLTPVSQSFLKSVQCRDFCFYVFSLIAFSVFRNSSLQKVDFSSSPCGSCRKPFHLWCQETGKHFIIKKSVCTLVDFVLVKSLLKFLVPLGYCTYRAMCPRWRVQSRANRNGHLQLKTQLGSLS